MTELWKHVVPLGYQLCMVTEYPKKYAHGFCFAALCCGYTLTDFPISIRLTSLALWQSNDCPSASKATLMNMDKYFMWIHYERLHNHNKAKHNKTVCMFLGIYCMCGGNMTVAHERFIPSHVWQATIEVHPITYLYIPCIMFFNNYLNHQYCPETFRTILMIQVIVKKTQLNCVKPNKNPKTSHKGLELQTTICTSIVWVICP